MKHAGFHAAFQSFMAQFSAGLSEVIAIDGKTLGRSFDHASAKSPLHLVSAWASEQRLVLGQIAVDGKSNEIIAVPKLLELLTLKGRIVTLDAMHCQRATAAAISDRGGDYLKDVLERMTNGHSRRMRAHRPPRPMQTFAI